MTFVFLGNPVDLTVGKKYRVVFKAKSLKLGEKELPPHWIDVDWPPDPQKDTRTDWGMIYGAALGISFVLDNTPDEGKTPGGTSKPWPQRPQGYPGKPPYLPNPSQVPDSAGEPNYPIAPKPADYCKLRKWEYEFAVPVWGWFYECFKWEKSGNGYVPKQTSQIVGNMHTFGWYMKEVNGSMQQVFGHVQYPWSQAEF